MSYRQFFRKGEKHEYKDEKKICDDSVCDVYSGHMVLSILCCKGRKSLGTGADLPDGTFVIFTCILAAHAWDFCQIPAMSLIRQKVRLND